MTSLKPDPEPPTYVPDDAALLAWAEFVSMRVRPVRRTLWLSWIDADHRLLPVLVPVDDIPDTPDPKLLDNLSFVVKSVIDKEAAVALRSSCLSDPAETRCVTATGDGMRACAKRQSTMASPCEAGFSPLVIAYGR